MFFQLGIQQGHSCFTITLINSKCIANALGKSLCFLAQSRKLFFRLEKVIFTLQVTWKQFGFFEKNDTSFFLLSSLKRIHPLS